MNGVGRNERLLGKPAPNIVDTDNREVRAHVVIACNAELARLAIHEWLNGNAFADFHVIDTFAHSGDCSGELMSKNDWRRVSRNGIRLELVEIRTADPAPLHVDLHGAGHDRGLSHVF
jgi:hypothetical protein